MALSVDAAQPIHIVEKAGFNRAGFMSEVWRALASKERRVADGERVGG